MQLSDRFSRYVLLKYSILNFPLAIVLKLIVTFSHEKGTFCRQEVNTKMILLYHFDVHRIKRAPGNTDMFLITYVLIIATFRLNINHV